MPLRRKDLCWSPTVSHVTDASPRHRLARALLASTVLGGLVAVGGGWLLGPLPVQAASGGTVACSSAGTTASGGEAGFTTSTNSGFGGCNYPNTTIQGQDGVAPNGQFGGGGGGAVSDPNAAAGSSTAATATDTLTITLSGGNGGTLSEGANYTGPRTLTPAGASNSYTLSGTGAAITAELDQLSFTPTAGAANTSSTTTFTLSDTSSVGGAINTDTTSQATDTDPAVAPTPAPTPTPTPAPTPTPVPTTDTVSIDPNAAFIGRGTFILTGEASSVAGVKSVEISAKVDGVETDLGAATLNGNGTFSYVDHVGANVQGFITATETDAAGGTASYSPLTSLVAGIGGQDYVARQDDYTPDGLAYTTHDFEKADGSRTVDVRTSGQTLLSQFDDTFANGGRGDTSCSRRVMARTRSQGSSPRARTMTRSSFPRRTSRASPTCFATRRTPRTAP